jgi:hypothetical protein
VELYEHPVASAQHAPGRGWETRRGPLETKGVSVPYAGISRVYAPREGAVVGGGVPFLIELSQRRDQGVRRGWRRLGAPSESDAVDVRERGVPFIFPRRALVASGSSEQRGVFLPGGPPLSSSTWCCYFHYLHFYFLHYPLCSGTSRVRQSSLASSALFFSFCLGTPPRPRLIPSRLVLNSPPFSQSAASRFPPGAETLP